jgi:hypothetical protein
VCARRSFLAVPAGEGAVLQVVLADLLEDAVDDDLAGVV